MSTLEYLGPDGTVNFRFVPWKVLNNLLSELNGNTHVVGFLRNGVNRGKVIEELKECLKKKETAVQDAFLLYNLRYFVICLLHCCLLL